MHMEVRTARPALAVVLLIVLVGALLLGGGAVPARAAKGESKVTRVRLGSAADVRPALRGPSLFLQGNGAPNTAAFQAHIDQVGAAPLDIVVLSASFASSGSLTAECDALIRLSNVNSCETVTITAAKGANDAGATGAVSSAEIVYFSGGDQCNYVGWRDEPDTAFNSVEVELAFAFGRAFWGQGYATEACRAMIAYAFGALRLQRLVGGAHRPNERSVNLQRRLGYRVEDNLLSPGYVTILDNTGGHTPPPQP